MSNKTLTKPKDTDHELKRVRYSFQEGCWSICNRTGKHIERLEPCLMVEIDFFVKRLPIGRPDYCGGTFWGYMTGKIVQPGPVSIQQIVKSMKDLLFFNSHHGKFFKGNSSNDFDNAALKKAEYVELKPGAVALIRIK